MTYTVASGRWKLTCLSQVLYQVHSHMVCHLFLGTALIGKSYIPVLPTWNLRLREAVTFPKWHTSKWQRWDLNPDLRVSSAHVPSLTTVSTLESTLTEAPCPFLGWPSLIPRGLKSGTFSLLWVLLHIYLSARLELAASPSLWLF